MDSAVKLGLDSAVTLLIGCNALTLNDKNGVSYDQVRQTQAPS